MNTLLANFIRATKNINSQEITAIVYSNIKKQVYVQYTLNVSNSSGIIALDDFEYDDYLQLLEFFPTSASSTILHWNSDPEGHAHFIKGKHRP